MVAIATDVIVRYLTNDDRQQAARARWLVEEHDVWVPVTVLLESEWVLRSVNHFGPRDVVAALSGFAGLPRVAVDRPERVLEALEQAGGGMDFADALHLSLARNCDAFVTFDAAFVRLGQVQGGPPIRQP